MSAPKLLMVCEVGRVPARQMVIVAIPSRLSSSIPNCFNKLSKSNWYPSPVTGQVVTVFEYKNTLGFDAIRAGVDGARVAWPRPDDFPQAKRADEEQSTSINCSPVHATKPPWLAGISSLRVSTAHLCDILRYHRR